jgi:hypothetical protein
MSETAAWFQREVLLRPICTEIHILEWMWPQDVPPTTTPGQVLVYMQGQGRVDDAPPLSLLYFATTTRSSSSLPSSPLINIFPGRLCRLNSGALCHTLE